MRVAIVTINFPTGDLIGGAELQAYFLAKHLPELGAQTSYVAMRNHAGAAYVEEKDGFLLRCLSGKEERMFRAMWRLFVLFRKERPDVCYVREFRILFPLLVICRLSGTTVVFNTTHERNLTPYYGWQGIKGTFFHALSFLSLRLVDRVIANNSAHADHLRAKYGILAVPILNSMEDHYVPGTSKERQVLWVANVKSRKRPEMFISLAEQLKDSGYRFVMVGHLQGDSGGYAEMIRRAEAQNPAFTYLGGKTPREVDQLLSESQIFVSTCKPEGFPNNIIQACLAECAIVSVDYDPDGIFSKQEIGFVPKTFNDTISVMQSLFSDEKRRTDIGKKARTYALERHSLKRNMRTFYDLFLSLKK
mgnify:CR=1 FL=1